MKIFAKENMVRKYKIFRLLYFADLCFLDHKLIEEIDEDGHPYYENDQIRQESIENLGFTFIRINPDPDFDAGFDLDVEIATIYNYINESSLKLAVNSAEKSLKENTYRLVCRKKTDHKNMRAVALENKIGQQKSTCADCDSKKSTFSKPIKLIKNKK